MALLHQELRQAREKAGLSQKALASLAGIPRNQVVRAERGENITVDTLRKLAAHLPLTTLNLLDTTEFRVDIVPEPEKLFLAAMENVIRLTEALDGAIRLAMETRIAAEIARRATPPLPGFEPTASAEPLPLLRALQRFIGDIKGLASVGEGGPESLEPH
jgi:transcriptional regulator with XRE-family HTH domain